jgi:hypothetical protein
MTSGHDPTLIPYEISGFHISGVFTPLDSQYPDARTHEMASLRLTIGSSMHPTAMIAYRKPQSPADKHVLTLLCGPTFLNDLGP